MSSLDLYRDQIMEHYRHPRNRGEFSEDMLTSRVYNALCGDDIEVGILRDNGNITTARFRGRACSICIASASMMTQVVSGQPGEESRKTMHRMLDLFADNAGHGEENLPEPLDALLVVKQHNSRKRCITLPWEALGDIIDTE